MVSLIEVATPFTRIWVLLTVRSMLYIARSRDIESPNLPSCIVVVGRMRYDAAIQHDNLT